MRGFKTVTALCLTLLSAVGIAQTGTTVTNSNNGTANTVPVYTGSSTLGSTSPITINSSTGNVGIGTPTPGNLLEVNGTTQVDGALQIGNGTGAASLLLQDISGANWNLSTSNFILKFTDAAGLNVLSMCDSNSSCNGRVGIGTANPQAGLDIEQTSDPNTGGPTEGLLVNNTVDAGSTTDFPQNHLQTLYSGSGTQSFLYGIASSVINSGPGTVSTGYAGFFRMTNNNSSGSITNAYGLYVAQPTGGNPMTNAYGLYISPQMVTGVQHGYGIVQNGPSDINSFAGKVGIGTTPSPGASLEVDGSVKLTAGSGASITFADGTAQTTAWNGVLSGGDYAESVDVSGDRSQYQPGDVIVIDPGHPGKFLKSGTSYSPLVAGIYSTKPGLLGRRQSGDLKSSTTEIPMAMVGVVPTKVSVENGPIRAGDLLVTSSKPGVAMKGTDRGRMMGAVVGKALASLDSGAGVIEVLVRLQ